MFGVNLVLTYSVLVGLLCSVWSLLGVRIVSSGCRVLSLVFSFSMVVMWLTVVFVCCSFRVFLLFGRMGLFIKCSEGAVGFIVAVNRTGALLLSSCEWWGGGMFGVGLSVLLKTVLQ